MQITDDLKGDVEPLKGRLPEEQTQRLRSLGINTAEELRDQLAHGNPMLLYNYLDSPGAPAAPLLRAPRVARSAWGRSAAMAPYRIFSSVADKGTALLQRRPRGILLTDDQRSRRGLPPPGIRTDPDGQPHVAVDLRARMPDIRNQGNRPTSAAFAVCSLRESLLHAAKQKVVALSAQFLYWQCKNRDGDPLEEAQNDMGDLVGASTGAGSSVAAGGSAPVRPGFFYLPTVLTSVGRDDPILRREIFGPVAPVVVFEEESDAIALSNDTVYGLAAYVYTRDLSRAMRVSEAIESGMVGINRGLFSDPAAPFGGVKQSGIGREGGHDGMLEFLETKYIAVDW